jgi:hypothetical protein
MEYRVAPRRRTAKRFRETPVATNSLPAPVSMSTFIARVKTADEELTG